MGRDRLLQHIFRPLTGANSCQGLCSGFRTSLRASLCVQEQSSALNRLLSRQGRHAHCACIQGGGWAVPDLQRRADSLASLDQRLELRQVNSAQEAECISAALWSCPVASVVYVGSAPCTLPSAVRSLVLVDTCRHDESLPFLDSVLKATDHAMAAAASWRHLEQLEDLTLCASAVVRSLSGGLQQLTTYPRLQRLSLELPVQQVTKSAASVLRKLACVEVSWRTFCQPLSQRMSPRC